ncbi:MAG: hypothetical protein WKF78_11060 [Candidatus Limnocylindrales bacterium]
MILDRSSISGTTERQRAHLQSIAALGGLARAARHDSVAHTATARSAFHERHFIDQVDPDRTLDEADRLRRASAAKRLHFARMAFLSHKARKANAAARRPLRSEPLTMSQSLQVVLRRRIPSTTRLARETTDDVVSRWDQSL